MLKLHYQVTSSHLPAPQILRVLKLHYKVASARLHFACSTRAISAEGCAGTGQIAPSPAFRALDMRDLCRGWRGQRTNRTLACISRTRHARSPQRVARAWDKSHSRLHFAHSTRAISAEGCARMGQIALWPAFRTLDTHDLRRGSRVKSPKRAFRTRHPQKLTRQSLQNERFVRDFFQKSSGNTHRSTHTHTHTSRSPAKQFRDSSPSKQHPLTRQSQCDSDIHLYHNSQPRDSLAPATNLSASTRLTRTKYCACHEMSPRIRHTSQPHDSLRLPRESHFHASKPAQSPAPATKSGNLISCELQQNLHHTTRLE